MLTNGSYEDDLDATSLPRQLHGRGRVVPLPQDKVKHREPRNKPKLTVETLWSTVRRGEGSQGTLSPLVLSKWSLTFFLIGLIGQKDYSYP